MSEQEEKDFLAQWEGTSETGEVLIAAPLRSALAQRLGRPVAASVIYRMLARHGWRKVAPDTRHPKSNALIQEEWKKNFPKHWQPS
ncbi:MAG: winged helix-turn-helix domain-containing protein [Rhodoferax sp.]|nr:winged helix-turn-helix domain-containing protein [Rhodoferax sp.]